MANALFTLADEMDPDREAKLRQVVGLYKSFKSEKNGDINRPRNVSRWGRKSSNNHI
jgi:hypothetical protein